MQRVVIVDSLVFKLILFSLSPFQGQAPPCCGWSSGVHWVCHWHPVQRWHQVHGEACAHFISCVSASCIWCCVWLHHRRLFRSLIRQRALFFQRAVSVLHVADAQLTFFGRVLWTYWVEKHQLRVEKRPWSFSYCPVGWIQTCSFCCGDNKVHSCWETALMEEKSRRLFLEMCRYVTLSTVITKFQWETAAWRQITVAFIIMVDCLLVSLWLLNALHGSLFVYSRPHRFLTELNPVWWGTWLWWPYAGSCFPRVSASCSRVMKMRKNTFTDVLISGVILCLNLL